MDLHAKREFLKAASLEAASGSLQGMKALERCLNDSHPSELSNLLVALAKATLIGLSFSKIPTSACEQNKIEHATLSLSCLAHLVQFDGTEEETLMPVLLERQEIVFPWLSFLLLLHNDSLLDNAQAPGLPLVLIISAILGYFSHNLVYYESFNVYAFNTIVEVWHRLQATTTLAPDLVTLAELVNNLFGWLVRAALVQHPIGYFVERVGGVSRVPALYAASLEKYHQIIALNPPSEHYPFLVWTVQNSFTLMYLFLHKLLPYATLSEACMRQVNQSIKQLFIHHSQLHLRSMVDDLRSSYIRFIFDCPATAGYYPILHMLQLGIAEDFRALESRSSVVEQVTQLLGVYAKFPAALPFIERFVCLPANRHAAADWATTDDAMSPYVSIWNAAQAEAKQYTGCTTCHKAVSRLCPMKVCSACGISRYCSTRCQRTDWNSGHRWQCKIFRLCGTNNPLIRTNNPSCLFYLSKLEERHGLRRRIDKYASTTGQFPVPAAEIPLLSDSFDQQQGADIKFKRFQDFPDLFDNEKIRQVVVPRIKDLIRMKKIPECLTVFSIQTNGDSECIHILSPSMVLVIGDLETTRRRGAQSDRRAFISPDFFSAD